MNKSACHTLCAILGMAGISQAALAQSQTLPPQVAACANEDNDIARLACYDKQNPPARLRANAAAVVSPARVPKPVAAAPVSRAPVANESRPEPKVAANNPADFGLSDSQLRKAQGGTAAEDAASEQITAQVSEVSERAHGELLLKLDNGQLWTQTAHRPGELIRTGEQVTIRKGALGAFLLTSASRVTTRVRRLE